MRFAHATLTTGGTDSRASALPNPVDSDEAFP